MMDLPHIRTSGSPFALITDRHLATSLKNKQSKHKITNMATITDFEAWLSQFDYTEADHEDIYCLYRSVQDVAEWGIFKTEPAKGEDMWIVSSLSSSDQLLLASAKAKDYLLKYLTDQYCGELDMEGWHSIKHAMSRDD